MKNFECFARFISLRQHINSLLYTIIRYASLCNFSISFSSKDTVRDLMSE